MVPPIVWICNTNNVDIIYMKQNEALIMVFFHDKELFVKPCISQQVKNS